MTDSSPIRAGDRIFATLLWALPTRAISRLAQTIAESRIGWVKNVLIRAFLRTYPAIDMSEAAAPDPRTYPSFNAFFTRALAEGVRPLPADRQAIASPVDGELGAAGVAHGGRILQTKGMAYDTATLLDDPALAERFKHGRFATFYLAPHNYHRVHMPLAATLCESRYLPGRLFGVNPRCVRAIPRLFTRNERLTCVFETERGPVALVLVGAFIVGGIYTRWAGKICPPHRRASKHVGYDDNSRAARRFARGEEMGHFAMGSSVIMLAAPGVLSWREGLAPGQKVSLGQSIGRLD